MESHFEQVIATLQLSSSCNDGLSEIIDILEKQNSEPLPSFISEFCQPLLTLEHWAWQLLSHETHQWIKETTYMKLFDTLALFNRNLVFNHDSIDADIKASLLIPEVIEWIHGIFKNLEHINDDNDSFIRIVSLWIDNLASFLFDNPKFETSPIISYINRHLARHYIMTDQFTFYLSQLCQSSLSQSIFTAKQLFYVKTCSLSLSSYLVAKAQNFLYTAEEMIRHFWFSLYTNNYSSFIYYRLVECAVTCLYHKSYLVFRIVLLVGRRKGIASTYDSFKCESTVCEYINALIRIIDYKPFRQCLVAQRSNDQTVLIDTTLFSLLNVAQNQDIIWFLHSKITLSDTLLMIAEASVNDKICLCVYGILGEILSDERLKELKISDSASVYFFDIFEHAWHHPEKKYKQIPMFYLLKAFVNLSKIDAIQQKTADTNRVSLLIEMCDQYSIVYDIIWALSFNHDIQQQLRSNTVFMTKLTHLAKEYNNVQMRKITHGILWNLESNHTDHPIPDLNHEKVFEIMISYSHKDEIICRKIYEELVSVGYRVWIDFDQMHGNVMDTMAQAIEQSNMILICMSEQYRRSNYCRAEAHYAFQRQLRIVPILLQEHYQPDGWLLFLVSQLFYIDFTKHDFSQAIQMLIKELKVSGIAEIGVISVCSNQEDGITTSMTSVQMKPYLSLTISNDMLEWNQINVQDWLISHGLLQMSRLCANFDGRSLLYMTELIDNLDLQQVVSLLQEDSLRRANQSLSLVELSHFRSLMSQHKQSQTSPITVKQAKVKPDRLKRKSFICCQIM